MICHVVEEHGLRVVGAAGSAAEAVELAKQHELRLAVVDLLLPRVDGVELTRELRALQPDCKILGISAIEEPIRVAEMMRAGAQGFVFKSQASTALSDALRAVLAGETYLPSTLPDSIKQLIAHDDELPLERLTPREREIYQLLLDGKTNDDIAEQLGIARRTVETHRQNILDKLGASSLAELYRIGVKLGLVRA